jgi:hypothetical protein
VVLTFYLLQYTTNRNITNHTNTMSNTYDQYIERDDNFSGGGGNHRSIIADNKMRLNFFGATAVKEQWRGTIVPPFDVSLIRDPKDTESYINSVGPCWTDVPDETRFFLPGPWSRKFLFYTFLGESNTHFMSPRCRKTFVTNKEWTDMDLADAFDDIRFFVRNSKALTDAQRKALLERTRAGDRYVDAPVPQGTFRHVVFSEFWAAAKPQPRTEAMALTASAYKHLLDQMRWLVDERNPSIGNTCKSYLLGDALADPQGPLVWFPTKRSVGDFGEANVMAYTPREQNTAGAERRPLSSEALRSRFLLTEESNWNIPSYQDMVDFAVAELAGPNKIPFEIIKQACGNKADIGAAPTSYATAVQPGFDPMADAQNRYAPAAAPQPTAAPVQAAPAVSVPVPTATVPVMAEPTYLVGVPGAPAAMTPASGLSAALAQSPSAMVQMPDGSWLPLASSGLVAAPVVANAAVVPVATVPSATVPVAAVPAAPATTPVAAAPTESLEDYRRKICPDERYARLTPAGLAEVNEVAQILLTHRTEGKSLDAAMMQRVSQATRPDYLG